jgi:pilus assembly protein Flp/PilA
MRAMLKMLGRSALARCERGATAVEYGLIVAVIVLGTLTALSSVATKTIGMWWHVANAVSAN